MRERSGVDELRQTRADEAEPRPVGGQAGDLGPESASEPGPGSRSKPAPEPEAAVPAVPSAATPPPAEPGPRAEAGPTLDRDLAKLRRRLMRAANVSIDMLEAALHALWNGDHDVAREVRGRDDAVDDEEVLIERECLRILALHQPYGQDFRLVTFCLKVNVDLERVADHATSIAKVALKIDPTDPPRWPVALSELGDRVPVTCQTLLRAVLDEDEQTARQLVEKDDVIDRLDGRLFDELTEWVSAQPASATHALHAFRVGRELERVGDLMANIAEDVVYLVTGEIIRHQRAGRC